MVLDRDNDGHERKKRPAKASDGQNEKRGGARGRGRQPQLALPMAPVPKFPLMLPAPEDGVLKETRKHLGRDGGLTRQQRRDRDEQEERERTGLDEISRIRLGVLSRRIATAKARGEQHTANVNPYSN